MKKKSKRIAKEMRNDSTEAVSTNTCEEAKLDLYADGSYRDGVGGCAWVLVNKGAVMNIGKRRVDGCKSGSVQAELTGIMLGLGECPPHSSVDVYSDCQAAISKINKGNLGELTAIYNKVSLGKVIRYHWVKAHDGDMFNEMADSLSFSVLES